MDKKTIVAVIVYDRFDNVKEWIRSWNQCDTTGAQLIIIHNYDSETAKEAYQKYCGEHGIHYVPHANIGYDIGRFQDVCRGRLEGFPNEWDYLIWCTDDCLPMRKDFVHQYVQVLERPNVGCVAHEISMQVKKHVRTTGFAVSQSVASRLSFPVETITTKTDCYDFEHRSRNAFYEQIRAMRLDSVQIESDLRKSPVWDSGRPGKKRLDRKNELLSIFPKPIQINKKVTIICLIYNSYPEIVSCLKNQTHENWQLILIHDGPSDGSVDIKGVVKAAKDSRIKYMETETRKGSWGFYWRKWALDQMKEGRLADPSDYVMITNSDNFYSPSALEKMVAGFETYPDAVGIYTAQMLHSYINWQVINCKMEQGYIDSGNVLLLREAACEVGWNDIKSHSSDFYFFRDIMNKYGKESFYPINGCHFVHN